MSDPERIKRLLIAACLAYIWIIYLGDLADKQGLRAMIERTDRGDISASASSKKSVYMGRHQPR